MIYILFLEFLKITYLLINFHILKLKIILNFLITIFLLFFHYNFLKSFEWLH